MWLHMGAAWTAHGRSVGPRSGAAAAEGAQRVVTQGRSVWLHRSAAWNCAATQHAAVQGAQRGSAQGGYMRLRWGAACFGVGAQCGAAHGRSVELHKGARWGCAEAQRLREVCSVVVELWAQSGAV